MFEFQNVTVMKKSGCCCKQNTQL